MINYNKSLSLEDFSDPEFRDLARAIFSHWCHDYPDFPNGVEKAKVWEVCQAFRGLADHGALGDDKEILGVGAGHEQTVFYLTNFAKRVFATDLYDVDTVWQEAKIDMLKRPEKMPVQGIAWRPRRLVTQYMDALDLRYEDESFDGIFSCGSIEHFGSLENVSKAAREMGRVLKPGGIVTLSTEYRVRGPEGIGIPGAILFTADMLEQYIVRPSGLTPVDPFLKEVDEATISEVYALEEALKVGQKNRSICLEHGDYVWTSASLCLRRI